MPVFPIRRLRRLRETIKIRDLMREITLLPNNLICPIFVQENLENKISVPSMPNIERLSITNVINEIGEIDDLNIPAIMLFGIPSHKDENGTSAFNQNGIIQNTITEIKKYYKNTIIISDVCLCQYTKSGHCGLISNDVINNDLSIKTLAKIAVSHAEAGADIVSPSAMMDGQVSTIRQELDDAGFTSTAIMSHSAKHSSSFYSPFRDIAECAPKFGDRKSYQVSFTNPNESIREVETDINEGADIIMIKPALSYLDLIYQTKKTFNMPLAAYSVSGEYALIKSAAKQGWIPEKEIINEVLHSIKRAGADMIITYFAKDFAHNFYEQH
jgi:porphobilinogen synthase